MYIAYLVVYSFTYVYILNVCNNISVIVCYYIYLQNLLFV